MLAVIFCEMEAMGERRFPTEKVQLESHVRNPGKRGWDLNQSEGRSGGKKHISGYVAKSAGCPGGRTRCAVFKNKGIQNAFEALA